MIKYQLLSSDHVISSGILVETTTPHNHTINELKTYFNGASDYSAPLVVFNGDEEKITLNLKLTARGYAGGLVSHGYKYGCNFNHVQNKRTRWGLTVWVEKMDQVTV